MLCNFTDERRFMIVAGKNLFIIKYAKFDRLCITTFIISYNYKKRIHHFCKAKWMDSFRKILQYSLLIWLLYQQLLNVLFVLFLGSDGNNRKSVENHYDFTSLFSPAFFSLILKISARR